MTITALPTAPSRSDPPATFISLADAFLAALPTLVTEVNAATLAMNLNATSDTSASSVAIGTGAKTFTVTAGKSFLGGMFLVIADDAAPSTNYMIGQVTSYSGTSLVMNILSVGGSGTKSAWTISQSATGIAGGGWLAPLYLNIPVINGYIDWSISGNALTASLKTYAGADPSATDPVYVTFRDPTLTSPGYYVRSVTAALSVTASSGSTLGTVTNQASRIRCVAMDNAGSVVLGLYNALSDASGVISLVGLDESIAYSSTAEGGAGAADSAQTIYTTAAQTSKAIRELSYVDSTQATAGTWADALTNEVQITATTPKAGAVLQTIHKEYAAVATGTTTVPLDDTTPGGAEGDEYMTQNITGRSASNLLRITAMGSFAVSAAGTLAMSCFISGGGGYATTARRIDTINTMQADLFLRYVKRFATTSSRTVAINAGNSVAGTTTFNGASSARLYGANMKSFLMVEEVMA